MRLRILTRARPLPLLLGAVVLFTGGPAEPSPPPAAADSSARGPILLIPARPDSAPPESEPAPFLMPGRPAARDSAQKTRAQRAQDSYRFGLQLEAAGSPGPAIISYQNALRFDPKIPDASFRIAMLFLTRDQVGAATKALLGELSNHPENVEASRHLGLCFARLGDSTRAIRHLTKLAREHPKNGAVWHTLGSVYLMENRPREAEAALAKALRLDPLTAEELRDMGATMAVLGRPDDARAYYRRALGLNPQDAPTWLNLGNLERRAGRPDSAMVHYRRAEAADSGFVSGLQAQIQFLEEAKRGADVVEVYRRWLRQHPDHHGARLTATRLLDEMGRVAEAVSLAREGTEQPNADGQTFVILGMTLRGHGDTRGALAALRQAEALFRNVPDQRERVTKTIAALRASAPDSLRALFAADSIAAAKRRRQ